MAKKSAINAAIWSLFERLSTQVVGFLIGIILARLLTPHDYGIVGLTTVFIAISNVFVEAGFANSLIRKVDRNEDDCTTAFYFNVFVGVLSYLILWFLAPLIAEYFDERVLVPLVRIAGVNLLFRSLCIVQTAIITSNLNIKLLTITNLCSQIPSGIFAVILAYYGMGVYALVFQTISSSFIQTILLWIVGKWIPKGKISKSSFCYLWGFGSKLLGASLIGTLFSQLYSVIIGKYIGKSELGFYSKAEHLSANFSNISTGIVTRIALPILAKYQNDNNLLCQKFREIMRLLVLIMAPISAIVSFNSDEIVILLWTEKWLFCAQILKILMIGILFLPISQVSSSLMQAAGRSNLILKLEFPKKIIYVLYILIGFQYGVIGLSVTMVLINLTGALINMYATKKILTYSYTSQIIDIFEYIIISYFIGSLTLFIPHCNNIFGIILANTIFIVFAYLGTLYIIKDDEFCKYIYVVLNRIESWKLRRF